MNNPILGVDLGKSRTGLAISENGIAASPLTTLYHHTPHQSEIISRLLQTVRQYQIATIVVGLPLNQDQSLSEQTKWCAKLIPQLQERLRQEKLEIEVIQYDEYNSTRDAAQTFPTSVPRDAAAAAIILQRYLNDHA